MVRGNNYDVDIIGRVMRAAYWKGVSSLVFDMTATILSNADDIHSFEYGTYYMCRGVRKCDPRYMVPDKDLGLTSPAL
jgi:hypothetical protein